MMRSRDDHRGQICISTHQYHPDMLLHTVGHWLSNLSPEEWMLAARKASNDLEMHKGLSLIVHHRVKGNEPQALRAVHWITEN
eukprot:16314488-Heterocapsa_arctica.AAC.1